MSAENLSIHPNDHDYKDLRLEFNKCKSVMYVALGKRLDEIVKTSPDSGKDFYRKLDKRFFNGERALTKLEMSVMSLAEIDELKKLDWPYSFEVGMARGFNSTAPVSSVIESIAYCERLLENIGL